MLGGPLQTSLESQTGGRSVHPARFLFCFFVFFAWLDLIVAGLILFSSSVQPLIICCCLTLMAGAANLCQ